MYKMSIALKMHGNPVKVLTTFVHEITHCFDSIDDHGGKFYDNVLAYLVHN